MIESKPSSEKRSHNLFVFYNQNKSLKNIPLEKQIIILNNISMRTTEFIEIRQYF